MKFRVERDALADAVAWTAKSLPSRPSVPVLAGVMLRVTDGRLHVSGFDYEVSSQVSVEVQADADGAALVSGRLLAEITKALPNKPVDIAAVGAISSWSAAAPGSRCRPCRWRTTRPCRRCPPAPAPVDAAAFAAAVAQVAIAAGRDETLPMMTGVRIELNGSSMAMLATDRYRLAMREMEWNPDDPEISLNALVPAKTLNDTAKTLGPLGGTVTLALAQGNAGEGMIGFAGGTRRTTSRLLDGANYPPVRSLFPPATTRRPGSRGRPGRGRRAVALVAERTTPVLLSFSEDGLVVEAGARRRRGPARRWRPPSPARR
jgi:DNA polymerase-3 subunit beta